MNEINNSGDVSHIIIVSTLILSSNIVDDLSINALIRDSDANTDKSLVHDNSLYLLNVGADIFVSSHE